MLYSVRGSVRLVLCLVLALGAVCVVAAGSPPRLTVRNNAQEALLVHFIGPSEGYLPVGGSSARTVTLARGTYRLFLRWGTSRYRYTKLEEPLSVAEDEEVELTFYTVAGNIEEDPSNEAEFSGR